jgi:hypothetical protein
MTILSDSFVVNTTPSDFLTGGAEPRIYTWDSSETNELSLVLNACIQLRGYGWQVSIQSPVTGTQRNYRIPIFAFKDGEAIVAKPVFDSKKINISGLKMLEIQEIVARELPQLNVKAVVIATVTDYDPARRTNMDYKIWFEEELWHS